jgi:hypothetical protein
MSEWQPIETAPKDGTVIILFGRGRIADGSFGHYKVWAWPYILINPTHWKPYPKTPWEEKEEESN